MRHEDDTDPEQPEVRLEVDLTDGDDDSFVETPRADAATLAILTTMYDRDGKLTADTVVAEAADPASPLHRKFNWDDVSAAHQYRLEQARKLIASVKIIVDGHPVRSFIKIDSTNSYEPLHKVMSTADLRKEAIADFLRDADRFKRRWENNKLVADAYQAWLLGQASQPLVQTV